MRLLPTRDHHDLAAMFRSLLAEDHSAPAWWQTLAKSGVLGLTIEEGCGGSDGELTDLAVFCLEAGRARCPLAVHSTLQAALAINWLGGTEVRQAWLPALAAGTVRGATALWSPRDAAVLTPTVRAVKETDAWRLRGVADFVIGADEADVVVLTAETDSGIVGFVVDGAAIATEPLNMMGGHRAFTVTFNDVLVNDPRRVLGGPAGLSERELRRVANAATALLCLDLVGVGEAVLQRTVDYTKMREQFGRPIASFQAAQHLVADMHIALSAARLAAHSAAFWLGRGETATRATAIARMHAAAVKQITLDAHQLHGGIGYVVDTDLHLFSERARILATLGGGADVAATWLDAEMDWSDGQ